VTPGTGGSSLNSVFRVAIAVQKIMTVLNGAMSEEDKIVAVIKTFIKLRNLSGH